VAEKTSVSTLMNTVAAFKAGKCLAMPASGGGGGASLTPERRSPNFALIQF
jgi:hypothetical protein